MRVSATRPQVDEYPPMCCSFPISFPFVSLICPLRLAEPVELLICANASGSRRGTGTRRQSRRKRVHAESSRTAPHATIVQQGQRKRPGTRSVLFRYSSLKRTPRLKLRRGATLVCRRLLADPQSYFPHSSTLNVRLLQRGQSSRADSSRRTRMRISSQDISSISTKDVLHFGHGYRLAILPVAELETLPTFSGGLSGRSDLSASSFQCPCIFGRFHSMETNLRHLGQ